MSTAPQLSAADILAGVAKRIAAADQEAHEANVMFAAGRFEDYLQAQADEIAERISDDADAILGDGQASGG